MEGKNAGLISVKPRAEIYAQTYGETIHCKYILIKMKLLPKFFLTELKSRAMSKLLVAILRVANSLSSCRYFADLEINNNLIIYSNIHGCQLIIIISIFISAWSPMLARVSQLMEGANLYGPFINQTLPNQ